MAESSRQARIDAFIQRWRGNAAGERATAQTFLLELCDALGVARPSAASMADGSYTFEKPVPGAGVSGATGYTDLYKAGHFVLEAKQGRGADDDRVRVARRGTLAWTTAMEGAFAQAVRYARALPLKPGIPWVITVDVGHAFELWSDFSDDRQEDDIGQLMAVLGRLKGAQRAPTAGEIAASFSGVKVAEVAELLGTLRATGVV